MRKLFELFRYYRKNGILWSSRYVIYYLGRKLEHNLCKFLIKLEQKNFLIGDWTFCSQRFTRTQNISAWNKWDWQHKGEEWTVSKEWKEQMVNNIMLPNAKPGKAFLEFGPGGGRWTAFLHPIAKTLMLIDISEKCLSICKERFNDVDNIKYHLYDGRDLSFIKDNTIDFIWSYDVFVHINPTDIDCILRHLNRIMKKDSIAVIHHAGTKYQGNQRYDAQRSDMTKEFFAYLLKENGMQLIRQIEDYVHLHGDVISIFKPIKKD